MQIIAAKTFPTRSSINCALFGEGTFLETRVSPFIIKHRLSFFRKIKRKGGEFEYRLYRLAVKRCLSNHPLLSLLTILQTAFGSVLFFSQEKERDE